MAVACCDTHTLTLDDEGNVWSFGNNNDGECGQGKENHIIETPTLIYELSDIVCISAGIAFNACVDSGGHVWTFGKNDKGHVKLICTLSTNIYVRTPLTS